MKTTTAPTEFAVTDDQAAEVGLLAVALPAGGVQLRIAISGGCIGRNLAPDEALALADWLNANAGADA